MKDLSAYAAPTLDLDLGRGRRVSIEPPSAEDGAKLSALVTLGSAVAVKDMTDGVKDMAKTLLKDYSTQADLARLAVGKAYDYMVEQKWPGDDVRTVVNYATFYWVFGETVADKTLEQGEEAGRGKGRRRGRNGRRTE